MTVEDRTKKIFRTGTIKFADKVNSATLDLNTKTAMQKLLHEGSKTHADGVKRIKALTDELRGTLARSKTFQRQYT